MSTKRSLLVQLDTDPQPSLFDRIVAYDAGAEEVLSYGQMTLEQVQGLVHGALFTRGPKDLHRTALYFGGSQVTVAEAMFAEARKHLIPQYGLTVSMMLDPNGSNTTAAAAVRCASRHLELAGVPVLVLGAGPVGHRVARLLAGLGAEVSLTDPDSSRLQQACDVLNRRSPPKPIRAHADPLTCQPVLLIAAGPAGRMVLAKSTRAAFPELKVMIDLNAVPPAGVEGVEVMDAGQPRDGIVCYGALGIGTFKMKIHKAAIASLFTSNTRILDAEESYELSSAV